MAGFPAGLTTADAELAVVAATDELTRGSLEAAQRHLCLAEQGSETVPQARYGQTELLLGVVRLLHARQQGNPPAVTEHAGRLRDMTEHVGSGELEPGLGEDLRALALISLGSTGY